MIGRTHRRISPRRCGDRPPTSAKQVDAVILALSRAGSTAGVITTSWGRGGASAFGVAAGGRAGDLLAERFFASGRLEFERPDRSHPARPLRREPSRKSCPHCASEICIKKAQIYQWCADDADILNFERPCDASSASRIPPLGNANTQIPTRHDLRDAAPLTFSNKELGTCFDAIADG